MTSPKRIQPSEAFCGLQSKQSTTWLRSYAERLGFGKIARHDLRRTFANIARNGGSALDQIKWSLGHGSIQTTERYLGVEQDLTDAPCDHLGLRL